MREWDAARVAQAAGARLLAEPSPAGGAAADPGPLCAAIDSRAVERGVLFVGLRGEREDGGEYAGQALAAGAWGVLVAEEHAERALAAALAGPGGAVLVHADPLRGLQALALAWRRELRARGALVVAITGSTGKTSTKDILAAVLGAQRRTAASSENLNTEIGLPLSLLAAPGDTEMLVLEMAMRGPGQIAELTEIAEPDVGVIVNIGPVHLELLGTLEAIAAAKSELIAHIASGATIVLPAGEPLLEPHMRADVRTVTFGAGGDVELAETRPGEEVVIRHAAQSIALRPSFSQRHNLTNLLAAVAAARALGVTPEGELRVRFSALRGERIALPEGIVLVNDCYNANPMSMRAAIEDLTETAFSTPSSALARASAAPRRLAVLGDMLELGREAGPALHREVGAYASARGVDVLVTVGPLAAEMVGAFGGEAYAVPDAEAAGELLVGLLREGDTVLVKGSRGVGLERVAQVLEAEGAGRR
ncbi:MAG TPA: UDP-N-acetylmuramoyl-tripeptide--D-alanyl-D-alanine ligase [Solirubrobacteraceae bacterium]|jgi:UDP-N-acetylmuramoyl-tripeptide--D-alanyl-D-alanine ligase